MSAWDIYAQNVNGGSTVTLAALVRPIQFRECWADFDGNGLIDAADLAGRCAPPAHP